MTNFLMFTGVIAVWLGIGLGGVVMVKDLLEIKSSLYWEREAAMLAAEKDRLEIITRSKRCR